ncbi:lysophospholipid acyltransferase family protein [Chitinibacteraceae bacterium HSL-7]
MKALIKKLLRLTFVVGVAWPVTLVWLGLTIRHRERLPLKGPAIVIANHNSHLDILTLYTLFPLSKVLNVQPAAAADYFLTKRWLAWFAMNVVGIIPVVRGGAKRGFDPLEACYDALAAGKVLLLFPEGTRGEPEQLSEIKSGLWYLAKRFPEAPIVPVYMYGLGRAMGKGQHIPVPFFVDVHIDRQLPWLEDRTEFKRSVRERFCALQHKAAGHAGAPAAQAAPTKEQSDA